MFHAPMRGLAIVLAISLVACQKSDANKTAAATGSGSGSGSGSGASKMPQHPKPEQIPPPFDLNNPPGDAIKTASGLIYKKEVTNDAGAAAKKNDTVMINYTGWKQASGETFFTNKTRGQPMPLPLANAAPAFTEALQLIKKGEKAMLWVPPSIGYKGKPQGTPETLVYEVEVVDIQPAPPIPDDIAKPSDKAETLKSGTKVLVVKPGTGKDKAKDYDTVEYNYSGWDADGRMFDSTEMRKHPATSQPFHQSPAFQEVLTTMTEGERVRFWAPAEQVLKGGRPQPGAPTGLLCYEVEVTKITPGIAPPPVPTDVAKPPADAKKTAKGVFYKVLAAGKGGPHPAPTDTVKVNYTGWTTDGKMFDSSVIRNQPAEFPLNGVIAGWTDGIPVMSVGDKVRFWIPEELAYKGSPGRPQGMLVFDVELLEIKAGPPPGQGPHGGPHGGMHGGPPGMHPPPPGAPPPTPPATPPATK